MSKIAFIGLGTMGLPMARLLVKGGHEVVGFDLDAAARDRHVENGGAAAESAADAARGAEFVFTMVTNASHVRAALLGEQGAASAMDASALCVDMSTIHPLESDAIRADLTARGIGMVDAPVGRTSVHAIEGKLLVMAGAQPEQLERVRPLLALLGDTIVDCGGPGMGTRMKMINNFMSIVNNVVTAEALTLAESIGLDVDFAIDVMSGTAAGLGHMRTTYADKVLQGDLTPAFMLQLAHKDLGLALDLAASVNVPVPLGAAAREMYTLARGQGRGTQDWTAMYSMFREMANLEK